jgi:YaiO family outer membrane protein
LREAQDVLDDGLSVAPLSPELLTRRARVSYFRGDVSAARRYLGEAQRVSPLDPEVREAQSRVFVGQARLGQRIQIFPEGYDDVSTTDVTAMQRWRKLRFEAGAAVVSRHGAPRETRSGLMRTTIIDGRPSFGTYYHFGNGAWAGGSIGVSAPALALPKWAFGLAGFTPLDRTFSLQLSAALWNYRDNRDVVIVSPALGIALTDSLDLTLRYWLTSVIAQNASGSTTVAHVHSVGARLGWRPISRLSVGIDYTYGVQLERNPTATELLDLRSHIVTIFGLFLITRSVGVDAAISVERRLSLGAGPDVFGPAAEVGVFTRW